MNEALADDGVDAAAERLRRIREEWELAPFRAKLGMVRLASSVRTDRVPARDYLEQVLDALIDLDDQLQERDDADRYATRGRLILQNDVAIFLNARRGKKRPHELRWIEARDRLRRAEVVLDADDPELWRLRVREAEGRESVPGKSAQALRDLEDLLAEAGYPERRNFRLSLHAMNLAVKLRAVDDDEIALASMSILEGELEWRTARYTAEHPFTMVAEANHILLTLTRLEYAADDAAPLDGAAVERARSVIRRAQDLHARRSGVLGERSGSAVRTVAYQARALRLCGDLEAARSRASEALALRGDDPATLRDDELPAIMEIVIADALQARREIALRNADLARRQTARPLIAGDDPADTVRVEKLRADELAREIVERLDSADDVLSHQPPYRRWVNRSRKIRASLDLPARPVA